MFWNYADPLTLHRAARLETAPTELREFPIKPRGWKPRLRNFGNSPSSRAVGNRACEVREPRLRSAVGNRAYGSREFTTGRRGWKPRLRSAGTST